MSKNEVVELGDRVKDVVTGFTGIAMCKNEWVNKCVRFGVQPEKMTKDGKPSEMQWIDVEQLRVAKKAVVTVDKSTPQEKLPNGPRDNGHRAPDAPR